MRAINMIKRTSLFLVVWVSIVCCFSERDTELTIEGGIPPKFIMTGSGKLDALRVAGPSRQREGIAEEPYLYWVIQFKEDGSARSVEGLSPIVYGDVPSGYVQIYPRLGQPPPFLIEDELYNLNVVTMNANGARLNFAIHKGKVVIDPVIRDGKPAFPD